MPLRTNRRTRNSDTMTRMFGTNGIRGVVNRDMNIQLAMQVGKATGACFRGTIAIAKDTRVSSDMISMAVVSGLMSVGCDVRDLGMVPTPALQYYVKTHGDVVAGIMITASHNPPEFNGIKVISGDGTEASHEEEEAIENMFDQEIPNVVPNDVGQVRIITSAGDEYVDSIVSKVDVKAIAAADLTVVLDCANGASCYTSPLLLKKLGVRGISLNASARGEFPGHPSEPTEENLADLKKLVKDTHANLGIAHDGDADRCVFVDNKGNFIPGDLSLALMSRLMLQKLDAENAEDSDRAEDPEEGLKRELVTPVSTSSIIDDIAADGDASVIRTAVGSPNVARRMIADNAVFGGEENGGLIFPDHQYCRDGGMTLARMLENVARNGSLSKQIETLPVYHTVKYKIHCDKSLYDAVLEAVSQNNSSLRQDNTDGLKLLFDDGWVHIRPSGTEPLYRIYAESKDENRAKELADRYFSEVSEIIESCIPAEPTE